MSHPTMQLQAPPVLKEYLEATVTLPDGEVLRFGRCRYMVQALPTGVLLTIISVGQDEHGHEEGNHWFAFVAPGTHVALVPAQLQGLVS